MTELTAPFVMKNDEKRIVYGPVLIPNEPDSDDDVVSAEKIEEVAHKFVEDYGNIDLQHSLNNVGKMIESYIMPMDYQVNDSVIPKGSWVLGVRVTDDDTWKSVKQGRLGGFSIMGIARQVMKSAEKKSKDIAYKRTTLNDLGDEWIVNAVSLVDEPAVPKAKWIAVKSKDKKDRENKIINHGDNPPSNDDEELNPDDIPIDTDDVATGTNTGGGGKQDLDNLDYEDESNDESEKSIIDKIMHKLGYVSTEKAGRIISESNYKKLIQAKEVIDELLSVGDKERGNDKMAKPNPMKSKGSEDMKKEEIENLIEKRMEPIDEKLDDLINTLKASADDDDDDVNDSDIDNLNDNRNNNDNDRNDDGIRTNDGTETHEVGNDDDDNDNNSNKSKDNEDDFEKKYQDVLKELENAKKHQPLSKRIAGQDGETVEKEKPKRDRNAFGYKIDN